MMKGYLAWEYTGDVPTEDLAPDAPLPDPALRRSPLAEPQGVRRSNHLFDCQKCKLRRDCMQSVIALAGFARTECEQELRVIHSRRETSLSSRVLAVLQAHPAGLTKVEIVGALGCGPLSRNSLETALETLVRRREVCVERSAQGKAFRYVACADGG